MAKNVKRIAEILGAKIVAEVPETGGGAFGASRLAQIVARLQGRVEPADEKRSGPAVNGDHAYQLPLSDATFKKLEDLAAKISTDACKVAPMQLAAELLDDAIGRFATQ